MITRAAAAASCSAPRRPRPAARSVLRPRGRAQLAAVAIGVGAGLGLIAATRLIAPHPRAAANLAYIEKVWEPPVAGGVAPSTKLLPLPE